MGKNKESHLLVIRLSALGDVAMTVPVLSTLVQQHPQLRLTVLTRPFFSPLFKGIRNVEVYPAEVRGRHRGILGLWRLYKELRSMDFDAVADLHNVLRTKMLRFYFSWGNTLFLQIDKGRQEKKALTRARNKVFKPLKTTVERYADVFRELGYEVDLSTAVAQPKAQLPVSLAERFGRKDNSWIGIAPFAAFRGKMYPLQLMEEVIRKLNDRKDTRIFLFGAGEEERALLTPISKKYRQVISMIGAMSFEEELALISNLDLMISMDSGNAHLASIYGVPVITLWGVTHPYAGFYPFGQDPSNALLANREAFPQIPTSVYGKKHPAGYEKAIESINPADILKKAEALIK